MSTKKRKLCGLGELELRLAYNSLVKLKEAIVCEESEEEAGLSEPAPEGLEQQLDTTLFIMKSKLEWTHSLDFSSMTMENLFKLNIEPARFLCLKRNWVPNVEETISLGQDKLWSSANLYRQLQLLQTLIPKNKASARAWIDAFFFRVSAMVPQDQHMVLNVQHVVPATTISPVNFSTLSGLIDYTVIVGSKRYADLYMVPPHFSVSKTCPMLSGFFVTDAGLSVDPSKHIPRAVYGMYLCARHLKKEVVRGAVTNGHEWIFLLVKPNLEGDGATFRQSSKVSFQHFVDPSDGQVIIQELWPDLISAILSHWIKESFSPLIDDDWFEEVR